MRAAQGTRYFAPFSWAATCDEVNMEIKAVATEIWLGINSVFLLPYIMLMKWGPNHEILRQDIQRWVQIMWEEEGKGSKTPLSAFIWLMTFLPEFRSLFYYRLGFLGKILRSGPLYKPQPTLFIAANKIGPGMFIQHGFSTIIGATSIGRNFWVNQQITTGFAEIGERPIIGDNVHLCCGAKVIGAVRIGNNSIVGANAVVVKDVPDNCTVAGVPAYIICRDGIKTREAL
jgi:serine O-acetyltransferase